MSSPRHERLTRLFAELCDLPPDEREAMLDAVCAGDAALRVELESLLFHHENGPHVLPSRAGVEVVDALVEDHRGESSQPNAVRCTSCGASIPPWQSECPSCATATAVPAIQIPGYTVSRLLGRGGMGEVYLAEETALGRPVAIKIISSRLASNARVVDRFKREGRMMAAVDHPNIVRVYSSGQSGAQLFLVMEYVKGESLAERLRRVERLSPDEALRIVQQTVEALMEAWTTHHIVHRDIKPSNILLDKNDRARVADFGLARTTQLDDDGGITRMGEMVGTPRYVSPEQACGSGDIDFRTDIYSLGIVLFEMLAGRAPFDGPTNFAIAAQHMHTPLPSLASQRSDLPGELESLCQWMTRKQPTDRPESYEQLLRTVEALRGAGSPEISAAPPLLIPPPVAEPSDRLPFVGREAELEFLRLALARSLAGQSQVVFVTGEAGSGKTALIEEFARVAQEKHDDLIVAQGNCDAQTGIGDPYLPFREVLNLLTGDVESRLVSGSIHPDHARRLWALLPVAAQALVEQGPDLLGTFVPGTSLVSRARKFTPAPAAWRVRLEQLARRNVAASREAKLQQNDLFDQYTRLLQTIAARHPLVLEFEDLHWADGGSCSLLFHLCRRILGCRVMIVCTYRPADVAREAGGRRHPFKSVVHELQRQFGEHEIPLDDKGTREFIDAVLDSRPNRLSAEFRDALYRQTQGHPLFTVELIRTMREKGMLAEDDEGRWVEGRGLQWGTLPARMEGAIGERLAQVPEELRRVLVLASVQGEAFVAEVVAEMHGVDHREMIALLSREANTRHRLVSVQDVTRLNGRRISTYRFRHNSFQTYLYDRMDDAEPSYLHEEAGTALETLYDEHTEEVAVQLARHFKEAEIPRRAVHYLRQAGERAVRLFANDQALRHLDEALELLSTLPDTRERAREELTLQLALGVPLLGTAGPGSPRLMAAYRRALELCEQVGDEAQLFQTLLMLVHHHAAQCELPKTLEMAEQMLRVAERAEEPLPVVMGYWARGFALIYHARFAEARRDFERVIGLYDAKLHGSLAILYGVDPAVSALSYNGMILWNMGFPDQALEHSRRGVTLARQVDHPASLAHALCLSTYVANACGDLESLREQNDTLLRFATEEGIVPFRNWAMLEDGWVLVRQGRQAEGIERMREAIAAMRAAGARHAIPSALSRLAEALGQAGRPQEGLAVLSEAVTFSEQYEERTCALGFSRIRGELLLAREGAAAGEEAAAEFAKAIEITRRLEAKSWELRAVVSLCRLLVSRGLRTDARQRLAGIYGWFTEGFETRDLRDAKALLDELS